MAHVVAAALVKPITPRWSLPVKGSRIAVIETVEADSLSRVRKVLQVWKRTYESFPKETSTGSAICDRFISKWIEGQVLVVKDARGDVQALARVSYSREFLSVEELVVAPWNNASCMKYLEKEGRTLDEAGLMELAEDSKVDLKEFTTYNKGTGTLMIYAVCKLVQQVRRKALLLNSRKETCDFYKGLGMRTTDGENFAFDLRAEPVPAKLLAQVSKYFPGISS